MDWAATHGFDQELVERLASEPRSRARLEIEEAGDGLVKLTLTHAFGDTGCAALRFPFEQNEHVLRALFATGCEQVADPA
jgi:hypothetical protein